MKKQFILGGTIISGILAIVLSYFYAVNRYGWILALTCVAVAALLICIAAFAFFTKKDVSAPDTVYRKKRNYISPSEYSFLQTLRMVIGNRYVICTQVPLVSVIEKRGAAFRNELFRVVDFMIADSDSYEPLLLIELNDASHLRSDRAERDRKVAEICAAAQLPLITFTLAEARDPMVVKRTVYKFLR